MVIAGPNGAGKSTCYRKYLQAALAPHLSLHIDPDAIGNEILADLPALQVDELARRAADEANRRRVHCVEDGLAFSMETVFSDPVGDKLNFFQGAMDKGYLVALLAVGLDSAEKSASRVARRVANGGHDVPADRIENRYPRVLQNFNHAVNLVSMALMVDNSVDNDDPGGESYVAFSIFSGGRLVESLPDAEIPDWWRNAYPPAQS